MPSVSTLQALGALAKQAHFPFDCLAHLWLAEEHPRLVAIGAEDLPARREDFHFKHWQFFADLAPVTNCPVLLPALELGADQPEIALCCLAALGFSPKEPMLELAHFALERLDLPIFFLKPFQRLSVHALVIVGIPAAPDRLLSQCLIFLPQPDILAK